MAPLRIPYRFLIAFLVVTGLFLCFLPLWDGAGKNGDYIDQAPYPHEVQNITTSTVQSLSHFTQGDTTFKPSKTAIPFGESSVNQTLHKYGKRAFKADEDEDYDDESDDDDPAEEDEDEGMAVVDDDAGSTITLLTANQFALVTAKGRNLLCMTRQSIADVTTQLSQQSLFAAGSTTSESLFTTYQALTANGYVSTNENSYLRMAYLERTGLGDTIFIKPAIEALGLSDAPLDEDGYNDVVEWKHSNPVTIQGTTYPETEGFVLQVYNAQQGAIFAWATSSAHAKAGEEGIVPVIPLKQWSDVTFLEWQEQCQRAGTSIRSLNRIFRTQVENTATTNVILTALSNVGQQVEQWPGWTFDANSDEGAAILGAPNGYGIAWLLIGHKIALGLKTVSTIQVWQNNNPELFGLNILFNIVDVAQAPVSSQPARLAKRIDAAEYTALLRDGGQYKCLLEADIAGATSIMSRSGRLSAVDPSSESRFTDYSDLTTNGWTKLDFSGNPGNEFQFAYYHNIGAAVQALGFSEDSITARGPNAFIDHRQNKYPVINGVEYQATTGEYLNMFNPRDGVIYAESNFGPRFKVQGNEVWTGPMVPLNAWADVVFLEYQYQAAQQGQDMKNLKYCFRMNVVNQQTKEVITQAILNTPGASFQAWPGWTWDINTPEAQAILGTENGKGLAWLLIRHKTQLGHKVIQSVTAFHDDISPETAALPLHELVLRKRYNLLFEIVDASASDPSGEQARPGAS